MVNNFNNKNNKQKEEETKVWLGGDKIVRIETGRVIKDDTPKIIIDKLLKIAKEIPGKPKILVNITHLPHVPSSAFRKKTAILLKETMENPGVEKAAIWGGGPVQKTVISFILAVTKVKVIRIFKNEEKALKWLKEA